MSAAATPMLERDTRIDLFRGLALVMIFINHMPATPWSLLTIRDWGFADAAEVFVLLAGIAAALAYARYFESRISGIGLATVFSRIWKLYRTHLFLFLMVGTLCVIGAERFNEPSHLEALGFDTFLQRTRRPSRACGDPALPAGLSRYPAALCAAAGSGAGPLLLYRIHWSAPLLASFALWLSVQVLASTSRTAARRANGPSPLRLATPLHDRLRDRPQDTQWPRPRDSGPSVVARSITIMAVLFTLAGVLISAPWRGIPGYENVLLVDPQLIGPISKNKPFDHPPHRCAGKILAGDGARAARRAWLSTRRHECSR